MSDNLHSIFYYPILALAIAAVLVLCIGAIYIAVRVGSIAHFRTRAEYDRIFKGKRRE